MSMIQEDFRVAFEVLKLGSIKAWGFTEVEGKRLNKEEIIK